MAFADAKMKEESLYELIKLTLLGSELTYAVSLMRELARRNQLEGEGNNEAALKLPMNPIEFQRLIEANPQLAGVFEGQNEDAALQFSAVDSMKKRNENMKAMTKTMRESVRNFQTEVGEGHLPSGDKSFQGSRLVYFSDQDDKGYREQTEMVYAISVDE